MHGVVETRSKPEFRRAIEDFDIVTPDGQPVRMALNWFHRAGLADRVYGPTLTLRLCEGAAREGVPVYFYGSTAEVVGALADAMQPPATRRLRVAGAEPSIFRPLTAAESARARRAHPRERRAASSSSASAARARSSSPGAHREIIGRPMVCVGAAFDFHAGTKRQAPAWMQDHALEWLFRLVQEPRRLFRRYAVTNTIFVWALVRQWAGMTNGQGSSSVKTIIVTGSAGLIGSEAAAPLRRPRGWQVVGVDNNMRRTFFGPDGDTTWQRQHLEETCRSYRHAELDIRDRDGRARALPRGRGPTRSSTAPPSRATTSPRRSPSTTSRSTRSAR